MKMRLASVLLSLGLLVPLAAAAAWPVFAHDLEAATGREVHYRDDGTLVVRAALPGIDPDKDVELTVVDGMLCIQAERREEEKREEKGYVRRELHYGSLSRSLPIPAGVTQADIKATYKAGMLEVRIPEPKPEEARKIPISKS